MAREKVHIHLCSPIFYYHFPDKAIVLGLFTQTLTRLGSTLSLPYKIIVVLIDGIVFNNLTGERLLCMDYRLQLLHPYHHSYWVRFSVFSTLSNKVNDLVSAG